MNLKKYFDEYKQTLFLTVSRQKRGIKCKNFFYRLTFPRLRKEFEVLQTYDKSNFEHRSKRQKTQPKRDYVMMLFAKTKIDLEASHR